MTVTRGREPGALNLETRGGQSALWVQFGEGGNERRRLGCAIPVRIGPAADARSHSKKAESLEMQRQGGLIE